MTVRRQKYAAKGSLCPLSAAYFYPAREPPPEGGLNVTLGRLFCPASFIIRPFSRLKIYALKENHR
ncbi:hypothetical protein HMPREF7215_1368 [Pyramidobacter piscolens W5455]|uniref:Uncharacterized protein n=1 Tax=Pyramidobacter piscolens W5455 TaxID=352165 RepID=A0ABM9ZYC7_9BACT|nr:hypothetical protein HMPREF7215_1368 [Pyramidobacter piscolens W5455]